MTVALGIELEGSIVLCADSRVTFGPDGTFRDGHLKIRDLGGCQAVWAGFIAVETWASLAAREADGDLSLIDLDGWNRFIAGFLGRLNDFHLMNTTGSSDQLPSMAAEALVASPTHGLLQVSREGFVQSVPAGSLRILGSGRQIAVGAADAYLWDQMTPRDAVKAMREVVAAVCRYSVYCGLPAHSKITRRWSPLDSDADTPDSPSLSGDVTLDPDAQPRVLEFALAPRDSGSP